MVLFSLDGGSIPGPCNYPGLLTPMSLVSWIEWALSSIERSFSEGRDCKVEVCVDSSKSLRSPPLGSLLWPSCPCLQPGSHGAHWVFLSVLLPVCINVINSGGSPASSPGTGWVVVLLLFCPGSVLASSSCSDKLLLNRTIIALNSSSFTKIFFKPL